MEKWELALDSFWRFFEHEFAEHLQLHTILRAAPLTDAEDAQLTQIQQTINAQFEAAAGLAEQTSQQKTDQRAEQFTATIERLREMIDDANRTMREVQRSKSP
jgi:esterase/lipase